MYTEKRTLKRLGMVAAITIIAVMAFAAQIAADNDPEVRVCAPDWTITAFDAIIKMEYIDDGVKSLEGQFDLSFDTDVVSVVDVTGGKVDGVTIEWEFVEGSDNKKIHVEFTIPDDPEPKTYGEFAKIHFDLVGDTGDSSLLNISDGSLVYKDGTVVSVKWTDDTVNIESFDVTVNAPESVAIGTFDANIGITDIVDLDSAQLELSFDSGIVNVTDVKPGKISGTEVPVDSWGFKTNKDDIVDTIIVNINLPGTNGVSGSGTLATITFDAIGEDGYSSVLDIDDASIIINTESDELPVNWIDATVTINSEAPPQQNETDTTVFVKNLDDDKLTVFLYIDGNYIDDKDVSSGSTKEYSTYKLQEGPHTFKIKWYDHDTKKEHEKIEERSVSGDSDVVVLYTVEHADKDTKISAHVYVKNNDDDPVDVYLYIDGTYKKYETIEAGDTCNYEEDGYEFEEEESHTFKIKWIDPDTDIEYEKITRQYIETAESVTMQVDSHTVGDLITVSVNAPDYMSNETFEVEIEINDVESLDSGQFCLLFDPNVLNVTDVSDGCVDDKDVTIADWVSVRCDKIRGIGIINVVFNIAGSTGASGSGSLATIAFEVTGKDGDCSSLNITNPNPLLHIAGFENGKLWDGEGEEISAVWVNSKVCIGDPSAETQKARVTVFVMNRDDDSLDIELYIDGEYKKCEKVSKDKKEEFSSYSLDEGTHEFKIRWYDSDTDEWYEKHEENSVSGTTAITLMTDEHGEEGGGINTHVYVKNLDDDRLDVYLYIDEFFKDFEDRISTGYTKEFGRSDGYELTEGNHTFRIVWYDPDTEKEHQMIKECFITGDAASVTIYIEKHDKVSTHVYVMNLDDDCLDVYLYIDEFFKDFEDRVAPGYTREFCESDGYKLTEGTHTFRIEWYDPDTGEEHQTTRECLIERDLAVTLYTEEHDGGDGGISARAYVENLDDTGDSSGSEFAPSTYMLSYWLPSIQSTLFK